MPVHRSFKSSLLALSVAATLLPMGASANHSWGNYHWARSRNPFTLGLGDNVASNWDSYLQVASSDWSVSDVLDTNVVAGRATSRQCRASTGRIEVCNGSYGRTGWLGVASISTSGDHIVSANVRLNDTYFSTAQYNTPAWRQLVTCQEVGHTFGLDHQDENMTNPNLGTCMDYTNSPSSNQHPNAHDYEELDIIYSHLDAAARASLAEAAPPAMRQLELTGPGQWGRITSRYANGKPKTYELDFGRGFHIVTHVFWAPDAAITSEGVSLEQDSTQ
jgi:hypothetical protein